MMDDVKPMLPAYGLCLAWTALVFVIALWLWNPGPALATALFVAIPGSIGNAAILVLWTRRL